MSRLALSDLTDVLAELFNDAEAAIWLDEPNPELGGRTPIQAVRDGEIDRVREVVEIMTGRTDAYS